MVLISMGFVSLASNEFILTRPGASHGLLLLSQGARRLVVVRVLHMLRAGGTIMPQALPKSNSRFRLMLRTCPAFESVPCDGGGSSDAIPTAWHKRTFWPGLQRLHGPLNDEQLDGLGYR
jgi:hypothetical protein